MFENSQLLKRNQRTWLPRCEHYECTTVFSLYHAVPLDCESPWLGKLELWFSFSLLFSAVFRSFSFLIEIENIILPNPANRMVYIGLKLSVDFTPKMKLSILLLGLSEAFLRCPRTSPIDCESCGKFNFKCKQHLGVRKTCAQYCRLEDMNCPIYAEPPQSCDQCNDISLPCQRRMGLRDQCREFCNPPVMVLYLDLNPSSRYFK